MQLRRTLVQTDHYTIDLSDVKSDQARAIDWLYHNAGALDTNFPPDGTIQLPQRDDINI